MKEKKKEIEKRRKEGMKKRKGSHGDGNEKRRK